ncbi:MAG: protein kinase [Planctomycetia bacterium]|nr:protein kinase [Planctomycetia bacterium]
MIPLSGHRSGTSGFAPGRTGRKDRNMPAPASVAEFLELVRKSGLIPEPKLDEHLSRLRASGTFPQLMDHAANQLVRDGLLTFFQAKQLKLGRYKRFTIGSKYRLLELIGAGGMGAVYLCEHTLMKRLVALKVLPVEKLDDQSNLDRFYREARAVAALDHPNIVRAYDIDQYDKLHFLVMEYVDGTSLQEIIARYALEKKLYDPIRAAHYTAQAAVGMQHAHELGMVHRDIKPGNLLLDRSGVIKVLDMGLARFFNKAQDSVTEKYDDKCVLGTADYLAPEQAVSNVVDVRADIYSLGGTLYFMLTGQTPFPDGTIAAKLVAHQTREPRAVDSIRPDVPPGIIAVLRKMMAKDPADRYQQPIEVAEALAEWTDQPIPPPPEREMPALCPLVQALAGPSTDRSGVSTPLARALFGPGRGVFTRTGGSSANIRERPSASNTASVVPFPVPATTGKSNPRYQREATVPVGGPVSTGRASASPTTPVPSGVEPVPRVAKKAPTPLDAPAPAVALTHARRIWLYVLVGVLILALVAVAATTAYMIGKANKSATPSNPDRALVPDQIDNDPMPGPADKIHPPAQAKEGEVQTVELSVVSASGTATLDLNSSVNFQSPSNFTVRISANYFQTAGDPAQGQALHTRTKQEFEGKTIRARGKILRDPRHKTLYLEVRSPKHIVIVGDQ